MLNSIARPLVTHVINPAVRGLARLGVTPDMLTLVGAAIATAGAIYFLGRGSLVIGPWVIAASVIADLFDGALARMTGTEGKWGAFLDSSLDRVVDGAIFASLAYWLMTENETGLAILALISLVAGQVVSYVKARAEGLGMKCDVGLMERAERLIIVLLAAFLEGVGVPYALLVGLLILAVGTSLTVVQRMLYVRKQAKAPGGAPPEAAAAGPGEV